MSLLEPETALQEREHKESMDVYSENQFTFDHGIVPIIQYASFLPMFLLISL